MLSTAVALLSLVASAGQGSAGQGSAATAKVIDPSELAAKLATISKRSVILFLADPMALPAPEEGEDLDAILARLKKQGLTPSTVYSVNVYQRQTSKDRIRALSSVFGMQRNPVRGLKITDPPADAFKDGKVTLKTAKGEAIDPFALSKIKFSKPLMVEDWFAGNANRNLLAFDVKGMDEREFLKEVAKSLGARFDYAGPNYRLSFDPVEFKTRTLPTIELAAKIFGQNQKPNQPNGAGPSNEFVEQGDPDTGMGMRRERFNVTLPAIELLYKVVQNLDAKLLETVFAVTGSNAEVSLGRHPVEATAVSQYLSKVMPHNQRAGTGNAQNQAGNRTNSGTNGNDQSDSRDPFLAPGKTYENLMATINRPNPGFLILTSDFNMRLRLNAFQRKIGEDRPQPIEINRNAL